MSIKKWYSDTFPGEYNPLNSVATFNELYLLCCCKPSIMASTLLGTNDKTILERVYTKMSQIIYESLFEKGE